MQYKHFKRMYIISWSAPKEMFWVQFWTSLHIINVRSPLNLEYTVFLYNCVLKPIWTYGSELWGNASKSNSDIVQRAQSGILRIITGFP